MPIEREVTHFEWNEFSKIDNVPDLEHYMINKAFSHSNYYHYTRVMNIENILNGYFKVGTVAKFNDKYDTLQFNDDVKYFYSICFSSGIDENLSLWYLYSGMGGEGGRIKLSKSLITKIIETSEFGLYERISREENKLIMVLEDGKTMKKNFNDVVYFHEKGDDVSLRYNTMTNYNFTSSAFNDFKKIYNGFLKDTIWYFEKESRLLVELIGEAREKIEDDKFYSVYMKVDEKLLESVKIDLGPEVTIDKFNNFIKNYPNIYKRSIENPDSVKLSEHAGHMEMHLCDKCEFYLNHKYKKNS